MRKFFNPTSVIPASFSICLVYLLLCSSRLYSQQDAEAKLKTEEDHAEGKPSSETLNKAKVKTEDALT